jgi:hypothetical protein
MEVQVAVELLLQVEQEHRVQEELVEQEQQQVLMDHPLQDLVVEVEGLWMATGQQEQVEQVVEEQVDLVFSRSRNWNS